MTQLPLVGRSSCEVTVPGGTLCSGSNTRIDAYVRRAGLASTRHGLLMLEEAIARARAGDPQGGRELCTSVLFDIQPMLARCEGLFHRACPFALAGFRAAYIRAWHGRKAALWCGFR